ncbi:MAG TPA: NADH-quinone oxidoreductase subunit NuoK [Dehalococcoidia bacterium]|nr:NADH-quinone oxidoreductase subunit NuoK [Dehalococcoidia bacterium]
MIPLEQYLVLSGILFSLGVFGVLVRRNAVLIIMSVELMLNAVSINLIAFAGYLSPDEFSGLIFAVFVITIAAAEAGLALGLVMYLYRQRRTVNVDEADTLRW